MSGSALLLNAIVFAPLAGALALLLVPRDFSRVRNALAIGVAALTLALAVFLLWSTSGGGAEASGAWLTTPWRADYRLRALAVDGSLYLVLLTVLVALVAVAAAAHARRTTQSGELFLLLAFEWTLLGLFTAGNLLLFYIYWDLMLIPVFYALVAYGGSAEARAAAWQYLIYNGAGGLVLLLGIVGIVSWTHSFEVTHVAQIPLAWQIWLFAAFAFAFVVKTPAFPFHAWMPPTYGQSPPPLVAMISGIQSKAGLFGFIAFAIPALGSGAHWWGPALLAVAVTSVLYGALLAMVQRDLKLLVGYSSVSHLGLVLLALFSFGFIANGAALLMLVSHGVIAAGLFLLLGMIEERAGTRDVDGLGGIARSAPRLGVAGLIVAMAALGLPGLSGFAGEFLIFLSAWQTAPAYTLVALISVVLASVYMLRLYQGAFHGPARVTVPELRWSEAFVLAPLVLTMFFLGAWPGWLVNAVHETLAAVR